MLVLDSLIHHHIMYRPSNLMERKRIYSILPRVRVKPLQIAERDLDVSRILTLMGADNLDVCVAMLASNAILIYFLSFQHMPLYMHKVLSVLRELGPEKFSYQGEYLNCTDPLSSCF
jgi:hypothetical protein